ncbi:MAG TPA: prepilin peptidase [Thermoanaerobaculia bacterium]|nr:prepilin peptidase [Thermoanaerobaculia bacterium]
MPLLLASYAFVLGAVIGSFLNVVIHRYPIEESIVSPPSRCPRCGARIRWWDNVPIISYLLLLGRCRSCRSPISLRYPFIELANGLFYLAIFLHTGATVGFVLVAAIVSMTIVLIFIDLEIQILPDAIDLPGIAIGLLIGWLALGDRFEGLVLSPSLADSLLGAVLGSALLLGTALLYKALRGIEGMGLGDVKMLGMIGAVAGWKPVLPLLFLASIGGAIIGLLLAYRSRQGLLFAIPFGVFLGLSTLVVIFFGHTLLAWYRSLLLV